MATLRSYDLNGQKLSFANWVSNITPTDTPFLSMTKKEPVNQTVFEWQTDALQSVGANAQVEGWESKAAPDSFKATRVFKNYTQILRKVVAVSDTAEAVETYGRDKELPYQMEKASQEIKRDLEYALLNNLAGSAGSKSSPRVTSGFSWLCSDVNVPDEDTGVILNFDVPVLTEDSILEMCKNLHINGSNTNVIMFHPKHAMMFSKMQEVKDKRVRFFENTGDLSMLVNQFQDQFGTVHKLMPNRFMPEDKIYFLNPNNWKQKILRAPKRKQLGKMGSFSQWMIEMEVGLEHFNPEASGIINIKINRCSMFRTMKMGSAVTALNMASFGTDNTLSLFKGVNIKFEFELQNGATPVDVDIYKDGELIKEVPNISTTSVSEQIGPIDVSYPGSYKFIVKDNVTKKVLDESAGVRLTVK